MMVGSTKFIRICTLIVSLLNLSKRTTERELITPILETLVDPTTTH